MPATQGSRRCSSFTATSSSHGRKKPDVGGFAHSPRSRTSLTASRSMNRGQKAERTVKRLRLLRALTLPDSTSIKEVCRRMAARKVDTVLLTDSNALLCGILTDKDIATRVIACEVNLEETPVSKVMTRNPVFVHSDALAVEALQKMTRGKFRHLPVVENGEVVAILDIIKCLYDVIARMERATEKGKALLAALEGVEKQWGTSSQTGPNSFIDTLKEQIFGPSLSTIISENSKKVEVDPSETVLAAAKKICELHASCVVVTTENKPWGIVTSKDMLLRVIAQNLPLDSTPVEKVMTPNLACARIDSPIVDALQIMHDGKFLHLPLVDRDGLLVTVVDVLQIINAVISKVSVASGINNESASTIMQNFWDSAMELSPDEVDDTLSEHSMKAPSDGGETRQSLSQCSSTSFSFKVQDKSGRMHRFICDTYSLTDLVAAILQKVGPDMDYRNLHQILYEDEDNDQVVIASDSDLQAAIHHARLLGWKGLRLHLDYPGAPRRKKRAPRSGKLKHDQRDTSVSVYSAVAAGAALFAALSVYTFMKRVGN